MAIGGLPYLALDRTGVALLGAIALIAGDRLTAEQAWAAIHVDTIALLFGMMVLSARLQSAGFYEQVAGRLARSRLSPPALLLVVVLVSGLLSAVLTNDVVCLALAPLLVEAALRRGLAPLPYLLGLSCGSNVGSAATLIGNPQNMLIGQRLGLDFVDYLADAGLPSLLGLFATWGLLVLLQRGRWTESHPPVAAEHRAFDGAQTWKSLLVTGAVVVLFLATSWPRDHVALAAAGLVLLSRRTRSRATLALVDWQLLVLFAGLFVVNHAFEAAGLLASTFAALRAAGLDPSEPATLFVVTVPLSNLVSNVPAVMLLLPASTHPEAGAILALSSTLAGNLLLVGSIANLIVADQAARLGVRFGWREHARAGLPVAVVTLGIAAAWLALRGS
ncbi:MAG: anion transporter [Planctomycetes bacterium]|nr:anion transporter [Planctomycetota bacterium]